MAIETPEKPDEKTPDPNPADKPNAPQASWFSRNGKVVGFVIAAIIIIAALILGLHHG